MATVGVKGLSWYSAGVAAAFSTFTTRHSVTAGLALAVVVGGFVGVGCGLLLLFCVILRRNRSVGH